MNRGTPFFQPFNAAKETRDACRAREDDGTRDGLSIKDWAEEDRPREKLLEKGEEALTKAELLAILIGSGTSKRTAVDVMSEVLRDCDDRLLLLGRMSVAELRKYSGIGDAKAVAIRAAMELGRRRAMEETATDLVRMNDSRQIYDYMHPLMRDLNHEECWVLMLNNSARLMKRVRVSQGGRTETSVDVRVVMKHVLLAEATAFILVHNHPSGSCRPSLDDERLTRQMREAGQTLKLTLLDHIVVADGDYYSFADNGKL